MTTLESRHNAVLRHFIRLGREKKYRRANRELMGEGEIMLTEALASGATVKQVLTCADKPQNAALLERAVAQGATLYQASDALFALASNVETPQNVLFTCEQPHWDSAVLETATQVLLLDGLQDPGNLGTILRTAEAFALPAVVLCEGCAELCSPKVVRATMGAIFRLPCVVQPLADTIAQLRRNGLPLYAAALRPDSVPLSAVSLRSAAVIVGNEGHGVSETALRLADRCIRIPMAGRAESLNASVAASLLIYEMTR